MTEGQRLEIRGDWVTHPQYGRQVVASEVVAVRPESDDELVRYLSSGVLPGVGPATAKARLLGVWFGNDVQGWLVRCARARS